MADGTSRVVANGDSLDGVVAGAETAPTDLLKPEQQLALAIAWFRFGALRSSDLVQDAWKSQFNTEPDIFPSDPVRLGQAVIIDGDKHQYGLHPISFAGQRKLSIYDSPEDEHGIDLFISKDHIDGVDHMIPSRPRYLTAEEAIRKYWQALNAFPDITGKWKMPEQAQLGLDVASLAGIDHVLREGGKMFIRSTNEWRQHTDFGLRSLMGVRLMDAFDNDLNAAGFNSYVEGALREANANHQAGISRSEVNSFDMPPAQESLLNWFVRLGGGVDFRGSSAHQIAVDFSAAGPQLGRFDVTSYFGEHNVFGTFKEAMAAVEAKIAKFKNQLSPDDLLLLK